jgi:squalene-hopene/tetraprenyl-beta-curcumene cyclase
MTHPPAASAFAVLAALLPVVAAAAQSGDAKTPAFPPSQQKAVDFLMGQQKDGVFSASFRGRQFPDPAITGFGLMALQSKPKAVRSAAEQKAIDQGLAWLLTKQNDDGSFGQQVRNYTTSVVVGALARSAAPPKDVLAKALKFLLACQFAEGSGSKSSDPNYGAMGYGEKGDARADLSNTNFALQALRESGLPADHEAFAKAITFLQRAQNLKSVNDYAGRIADPENKDRMLDVNSGDDGGGIYYPGNSGAGYVVTPDGKAVARSYGSMTYSLLKAYTLCGVKPDDPRVQAAVKWVSSHWLLTENPGVDEKLGDAARHQGLFYYYMVMAQALDLVGAKELAASADGKPAPVDWRKALRSHLESTQKPDGSWVNEKNPLWMEDSGVLCACYALLALEKCR